MKQLTENNVKMIALRFHETLKYMNTTDFYEAFLISAGNRGVLVV
jgi:hypothetical protein